MVRKMVIAIYFHNLEKKYFIFITSIDRESFIGVCKIMHI